MNIKIKVDGTDHFGLFCPKCGKIMKVKRVFTNNVLTSMDGKNKDKCSYIAAYCKDCNFGGQRKIYWKEDGRYLR